MNTGKTGFLITKGSKCELSKIEFDLTFPYFASQEAKIKNRGEN